MLSCTLLLYVAVLALRCGAEIFSKDPRRPLKASEMRNEEGPLQLHEQPGVPWPMPKVWQPTARLLTLDTSHFFLTTKMRSCDIVTEALHRYRSLIQSSVPATARPATNVPVLDSLEVVVVDYQIRDCQYPYEDANESYIIDITNGRKILKASTTWGVLRGLETFTHLIYTDKEGLTTFINETYIEDSPRYTFRSILIDTSRHYLPVWLIKQNLDVMSYNKFNVLHWHIVDDQSWPLQLKSFPNLTEIGAFSRHHIYTEENVQDIIEYARLRGIRVIPEIDAPGHTQALGNAIPSILTACYGNGQRGTGAYGAFRPFDILDPMHNKTYQVMTAIYAEVKSIFKDEYIHLGMDEVYPECWRSSPEVAKYLADNNYSSIGELESLYIQRTLGNIKTLKYKPIIWEDPVTNDAKVDNSTIVIVWKPDTWPVTAKMTTKKGYRTVIAACWYLDLISYGEDWKTYYECEPEYFATPDTPKELVIGGEACLWGEYVDETNFIQRLWPRASAVAERLWSPAELRSGWLAKIRLDHHRCRMLRRGVPAQPLMPGYCRNLEYRPYAYQGVNQEYLTVTWFHNYEPRTLFVCGLILVLGCAWITKRHHNIGHRVFHCTRWIVAPTRKVKAWCS